MRPFYTTINFRLVLLTAISAVVLFLISRKVYPEATIQMTVPKEEIRELADHYMDSLGIKIPDTPVKITLAHNGDLMNHLQNQVGQRKANLLISGPFPVFWWDCEWQVSNKKEKPDGRITIGNNEESDKYYRLKMTLAGRVFGFNTDVTYDSTSALDTRGARSKAGMLFQQICRDTTDWTFSEMKTFSDHLPQGGSMQTREFLWIQKTDVAAVERQFSVKLTDSSIVSFEDGFRIPERPPLQKKAENILSIVTFLLLYMLFVVLGVVFMIKRLRSDRVDLLSGMVPGLIVAVSWALIFWHMEVDENIGAALLGFFITMPFIAGAVWVLFVLGESFAREVWPEKLKVFDELRRRHLTSRLGMALIRGCMLGLIYLTLHAVILFFDFIPGLLVVGENHLALWSASAPWLLAVAQSLMSAHFIILALCLFLLSLMRKTIKNRTAMVIIAVFVWALVSPPVHDSADTFSRIPFNILMGAFTVFVFLRFELLTALTSIFTSQILFKSMVFLTSGDPAFRSEGLLLAGLLTMLAGLGIWLIYGRRKSPDTEVYVPDYVKRTFHREQLQRELEIARNVQLNFLPQQTPDITGLDIASYCMPAREVGGDYFDFIRLDENRLGVVIGDVSGKGIPAAFYMTLTKGLFKAQAANQDSPREVLISLNRLFFENAKRGVFISMIYCIFDLTRRTMTFARAGHNPIILHRSLEEVAEEVCPPGIAIGLEQNEIFSQTIQEREISLQPHDIFMLYTDGLNEAQNLRHEAFGEKRLLDVLRKTRHQASDLILSEIEKQVNLFTGEAEQFDDMTAVLIKIDL